MNAFLINALRALFFKQFNNELYTFTYQNVCMCLCVYVCVLGLVCEH